MATVDAEGACSLTFVVNRAFVNSVNPILERDQGAYS
jgi:hypothetical protein